MSTPRTLRRRIRTRTLVLLATTALLATALSLTSQPAALGQDLSIPEIQGTGHLSPYDGETVTTTGVVTAVAFNGFYMQDPVGDGNALTSDGIFVSGFGSGAAVGDEVSVTGTVSEFIPGGAATGNLSTTQLSGSVSVLSAGNPLPHPVEIGRRGLIPPAEIVISDDELPTNLQTDPANFDPDEDGIDFYEALEGMYVAVNRPVAVSATRQFSGFSSEVFVLPSRGRLVEPDDARTSRGGILLQPHPDNRGDQNPERVQIQFDGTIFGAPPLAIKVGDRLSDVRGVVGYSFGNYEVNATETFDVRPSNTSEQSSRLRPTMNRLTVASYNVLNLSPDSSDDAQRAKLAAQIVHNLNTPDVVALQEIQDNSGEIDDGATAADLTLQALVDEIVAAGGPVYTAFDVAPADGASGGIPGGNIRNAFLYNADRVGLVDSYSLTAAALGAFGVSNSGAFDGTRDPLVGVFSFNEAEITVINNHLTSRFGSTPIFGGPQPFVQAGEAAREAQVGALNEVVDVLLHDDPYANIMVLGDLNTFEWTNDLADILPGSEPVLTNLLTEDDAMSRSDERNPYTFIFDGNSQALDHVFVSDHLLEANPKLDIVHTNVDFARLFGDVTASDHEPLLTRVRLRPSSEDW